MEEKEKRLTTEELIKLVHEKLDDEATARQNTNKELEQLTRQQYSDLQNKITKHAGERFAFHIRGTHERTLAYGPRENRTSPDSFDITYVGRIQDENPTLEKLSDDGIPYHETGLRFPARTLYRSSQPLPKDLFEAEDFYLNFWERNCPSWNLEEIFDFMLPQDLREKIQRRSHGNLSPKNAIFECTLAIGNTEFDLFLSVTDISGYLTRAIEIINL